MWNTWNNGSKPKELRFRLDKRIKYLLSKVRVVRQWNKLLRDDVDTPFLEVLKARLNRILSNPVW